MRTKRLRDTVTDTSLFAEKLPPEVCHLILEHAAVVQLDLWQFTCANEIFGGIFRPLEEASLERQRNWCREHVWIKVYEYLDADLVYSSRGIVRLHTCRILTCL